MGQNTIIYFFIIDHFSKLSKRFLLENKTKEAVLPAFENFCKIYSLPEKFGCDNGREFINNAVLNFLNKNNIKLVKGAPYSPHLQGVVERIHITIRKALINKFLEDQNNFDIEKELPNIMNTYNNIIHNTTKHTLFEVFYSNKKDLFSEVYNNIITAYNKSQKDTIIYKKDEKCLILNGIMKSKNKTTNGILFLIKK